MKLTLPVIVALIKKDLRGLLPLAALTATVIALDIVVEQFYRDSASPLLSFLATYLPWLSVLTGSLLVISAMLQDPAVSLRHDWLTRPIAKHDLLVAKLCFLGLVIFLPMFLFGFVTSLASSHSVLESLLWATSIDSWWIFLIAPFIFILAFLSRSLMNAFSNILAALLVLMLPATFMPALPLNPDAVGDDLVAIGILWILLYPMGIALLALLLYVYWLQYEKKQTARAWWVSLVGLFVTIGIVIGAFGVSSWPGLVAMQQTVVNGPDTSQIDGVIIEEVNACFPASVIGVGGGDGAAEAQPIVGAQQWTDFRLRRVESGSVAFATNARARVLPRDWRAVSLHAKAVYNADGISTPIELKPASYQNANAFGPYDNTSTHYWLLPEASLQLIKDNPSTELTLDYTMALLSPNSQELATDNVRRYLPGIGYCSAEVDEVQNEINVDCFKRGAQPALLAAELIDVSASRVDSIAPNYIPAWVEFLGSKRYELTLQVPSLVDHSKILMTAYNMEAVTNELVNLPGVLGGETSACMVPTIESPAVYVQSNWSDTSPHEVSMISVEPGVSVEVLDWGGSGPILLLLAGAGATAHYYDDLAPKLAESHRVVGITRRGFGNSSKPYYGYDMDRLSEDILQVIDAMNLDSPILVGHSLAGDELSTLGAKYPERFSGLVYLDAAYDRSGRETETGYLNRLLPRQPRPLPSEMASYETARDYFARISPNRKPMPEGELMVNYALLSNGSSRSSFDPRVGQALMADIPSPNYANIPLPALAIYALETSPESFMRSWYDPEDPTIQQITNRLFQVYNPMKLANIEKFDAELPNSEVIILEDAAHSIFLSHEDEVLRAISTFVDSISR